MANESTGMSDNIFKSVGKNISSEAPFLNGHFHIEHVRNGVVIDTRDFPNMICDEGKAELAKLMLTDVGGTAFDYVAIGNSDVTPVAHTDIILNNETHRVTGVGTVIGTTYAGDTAQLVATFSFTSAYAIKESGVFNAAAHPDAMMCHQIFAAINVDNGDSLIVTWRVQITAAI